METDVSKFIKTCSTCQRFKKSKKKYDNLPPKEVSMTPSETVCIDLICPYTVTDRSGNDRIVNAMTFVDPATGWFEITEIIDKTSARISQILIVPGWHATHAPGRSFLTMGMNSRRISYHS